MKNMLKFFFVILSLGFVFLSYASCPSIFQTRFEFEKSSEPAIKTNKKNPKSNKKSLITHNFFNAVLTEKFNVIGEMIKDNPFLKKRDIRLDHHQLYSAIKLEHANLTPSWGVLQLAVYLKKYEMLDFLLREGVNARTLKRTGGVSIESNALHIAIQKGDLKAIQIILNHQPLVSRRNRKRGHFIDEKDFNQKTPLFLAILNKNQNSNIIDAILQAKPSGEVEVLYKGKYYDGLDMIKYIKNPELKDTAVHRLKISSGYWDHRALKRVNPFKRAQPQNIQAPR